MGAADRKRLLEPNSFFHQALAKLWRFCPMQLERRDAGGARDHSCLVPTRIHQDRELLGVFRKLSNPIRFASHVSFAPGKKIEPEGIGPEVQRRGRILRRGQPADFDPQHYAAVAKPSAGLLKSGAGISFTSFTMPSCHLSLTVCR